MTLLYRFILFVLPLKWACLFCIPSVCIGAVAVEDSTQFRLITGGVAPKDAGKITMTDWLVVGPFHTSTQDAWTVDYLELNAGISQTQVLSLDSLEHGLQQASPSTQAVTGSISTILDFHHLLGMQREMNGRPAVAYACTVLRSTEATTGWLLVSSSDGAQAWLNGSSLYSDNTRHGVHLFDTVVPVKLNAGENVLVCRVPKFGVGWGVIARFESDIERLAESALVAQDTLQPLLLKRVCVREGEALEVAPRGIPRGTQLQVRIRNSNREILHRQIVEVGEPIKHSLPFGLYSLEVATATRTFSESFISGTAEEVVDSLSLIPVLQRLCLEHEENSSYQTLLMRLSFLVNPDVPGAPKRDRQWERSVVHIIREAIDGLKSAAKRVAPFANTTGMHLRGFRSQIDGLRQSYRIFVPEAYDPRIPSKLVLLMPTTISANKPFIESVFLRQHLEAERYAAIASRLNTILVWPGYRNQPKGMPCELTHLDEVIKAVEADYNIDRNAICLIGACAGGALGTQAVAKWPERFAGFAVLNPMFGLSSASPAATAQFAPFVDFRNWRSGRTAVTEFLKVRGVPTLVVHDGGDPGHGDYHTTESFIAIANAFGVHVELSRITQGLSQHFDAWNRILTWCASQRRSVNSSKATDVGDEDRIVSVFESRFVVVVGTGGTKADQIANREAAEMFRSHWRKSHFGECIVANDTDLKSDDELESNLILVGAPDTNLVWRRSQSHLNVAFDNQGITLNGKRVSNQLGPYHILCRDSRAPSRKVLLFGIVDARSAPSELDLTYDGWYTYAVWRREQGGRPVAAGLMP